ncbi:MAG TPA: acyltransferase domain-containing protein [Bryobacteraceae bacterium]
MQDESVRLSDAAYTLGVGRHQFKYRRAVVAETIADACAALAHPVDGNITETRDRPVAFLFPGLGDHVPGLAAGLFQNEPGFRERMDECARILKPLLDADIRDVLFSADAVAAGLSRVPQTDRLRLSFSRQETQPEGPLSRTLIAQPAVFAVEYALAGLLADWGIAPDAMIGYSIGEYAAACIAGVFSLPDALQLVAARARMIDALPASAMAAIPLAEQEVRELLNGDLSICISNGPTLTVVGGPDGAVADLERKLISQGIASRRLAASHAFHSAMMDPIVASFAQEAAKVSLHPPRIPFVSNVTGDWIDAREAVDPRYWARHLRQTVRFGDGLEKILSQPDRILLEVGPGQALSTLTRQHPAYDSRRIVIAAMRDRNSAVNDALHLRTALGRLWQAGAKVDWAGHWSRADVQRVPLPTYPFERQRCWIEPGSGSALFSRRSNAIPMDDRFYVPVWRPAPLPLTFADAQSPQRWLIFTDENGIGERLAEILRNAGHAVTTVRAGALGNRADYRTLLEGLREAPPTRVVHLSSAVTGFYSLLYFAQTLGEQSPPWPMQIDVVSSGIQDVTGDERIQPENAVIVGPLKVIPQEYAGVSCRHIDMDSANAEQLAREVLSRSVDNTVAWRGRRRWIQTWSRTSLERPAQPLPLASDRSLTFAARKGLLSRDREGAVWPRSVLELSRLKENGVYLIAGGLEGTGLIVAEHLARKARARLVLLGPESFPERGKWELWLQSHDDRDDTARAIRRLRAIEFSGCGLFIRPVDIVDEESMRRAVEDAVLQFGSINGVIHAAGPPGAGLIQLKTAEMIEAVLAPKLKGAMVLDRLTRQYPLDFFLVFSSLTALGGGLGQVDTCAAGAFLDAYAHQHANDEGCFTGTINWSPFQWEPWQLPALPGGQGIASQIQNTLESSGIGHDELADALDRILAGGLTQVAVSAQDLNQVLEQTNAMTASKVLESLAQARPDGAHGRPELAVAYEAPRNATEETIAAVWAKSFGLERVGIHDGFFDLDGNSLLAIQIVTRLRTMFDADLPMTALFDSPTVAGLARHIDAEERSDELEALLGEIEQLSPADAEALLAGDEEHSG